MDIATIVKTYRKTKNLTQKQLADMLNLSDKTISKWERGAGLPDISVLSSLADALGISIDMLLGKSEDKNIFCGGNMKNSKIYVCPVCGNILVSTGEATVSCCERKLEKLTIKKTDDIHDLSITEVEDEWYISSNHPMNKEHYISFCAFLTGEKIEVFKQYPEWNVSCRIKRRGHGKLVWYCTKHELFYKNI